MTYLALMVSNCNVSPHLEGEVLNFLSEVLLPKVITRSVIERYVRKAYMNKSWFTLNRFQRALLRVASRVISIVKSPTLINVLKRIFVRIELGSLRGRALYYGFLLAQRMGELLTSLTKKLTYIMLLGINYLNNPPLYRVLG